MIQERSEEKITSRNGRQEDAGLALQAPALCRPACRRHKGSGRRGSQVIEYAIVVAALAAAFTTMFVYGKRGVQGVIRSTVDSEIGPQADGLPTIGFAANESSSSSFDTVSGDDSHVLQGANGTSLEVDAFTSSSGAMSSFSIGN